MTNLTFVDFNGRVFVLPNGLTFNTQAEVDAYFLGIEMAKVNVNNMLDMIADKKEFVKNE